MALPQLEFTKSWTSALDFPTEEPDEAKVRADAQLLHDEAKNYINTELLPTLEASTAATHVGADVASVGTKTVQAVLDAHETRLNSSYTATQTESLVGTNTNDLVKSVTFNDMDGKFTFTKKDGSTVVIDTILEKVPVSMVFETVGGVTRIKLTNQDGSTSFADVSALVDNYTFSNTTTVALTSSGTGNQRSITADVRDASVGLSKFTPDVVTTFEGYVSAAGGSATSASNSATAAASSASTATTKASEAAASAVTATTKASEAATSASTATTKASDASTFAANANTSKLAAETASAQAVSAKNEAVAAQNTAVNKASEASTSAANAATSETNALASKNAAATSETNAANSASVANLSASNASTSASNASTSATAANTSKNAAATSAVNAATSETNAAASANAAAASAAEAAAVVGQKVATFNGRDGVVVPQFGDYTPELVGAAPASHSVDALLHKQSSGCTQTGAYANAEGLVTQALGSYSHAEGVFTESSGSGAHAEGIFTAASGDHSHAQNEGTIAQGVAQTTLGLYNLVQGTSDSKTNTDHALIVGNGSSNFNRSNAMSLTWEGTLDVAKDVKVAGVPLTQKTIDELNKATPTPIDSTSLLPCYLAMPAEWAIVDGKFVSPTIAPGETTAMEFALPIGTYHINYDVTADTNSGILVCVGRELNYAAAEQLQSSGGTSAGTYTLVIKDKAPAPHIMFFFMRSPDSTESGSVRFSISSVALAQLAQVEQTLNTTREQVAQNTSSIAVAFQKFLSRYDTSIYIPSAVWEGAQAPYTATVTDFVDADASIYISPCYSTNLATALAEKAAYACIDMVEIPYEDTIVFTALEEKPTIDLHLLADIYQYEPNPADQGGIL